MKKDILKKIGISLGILLTGIVVGYFLMVLVYCIDVPESKYSETMKTISEEGCHPRELLRTGKSDYYHENYPDILDNGTDEYIFEYVLRNTDENCFERAMIKEYERYWHGYVVFLRPLMLFLDLSEFRILNVGAQLFLFLTFIILIYNNTKKIRYLLVPFAIYFMLVPNTMAMNLQYSSIYYVSIISGIAALGLKKYLDKNNRYIYLFLLSGMATAYIDFLTYPLLAWSVPATVVIMCYKCGRDDNAESYNWWNKVIQTVISALVWIAGYLIMWSGKWTIGIVIPDIDSWGLVTQEGGLIIGVGISSFATRIDAFTRNWRHLTYKPFVPLFVIVFIYWAVKSVKKGMVKDSRIPAFVLMIMAAPVWYYLAFDHARGHHVFTWRMTMATVMAAFMIVCLTTDYSELKKIIGFKSWKKRLLLFVGCLAIGTILYSVTPVEKQTNWNYHLAKTECSLAVGEENAYVMDFIPMYNWVYKVSPVINSYDYEGYAEIILSEGDREIDRQKITFDGTEESNVKDVNVNWHLKRGNRYQITISTKNMKKPPRVWTTNNTELYEFDGDEAMGIGYSYNTMYTSKLSSAMYIISWATALLIICYVISFFVDRSNAVKKQGESTN